MNNACIFLIIAHNILLSLTFSWQTVWVLETTSLLSASSSNVFHSHSQDSMQNIRACSVHDFSSLFLAFNVNYLFHVNKIYTCITYIAFWFRFHSTKPKIIVVYLQNNICSQRHDEGMAADTMSKPEVRPGVAHIHHTAAGASFTMPSKPGVHHTHGGRRWSQFSHSSFSGLSLITKDTKDQPRVGRHVFLWRDVMYISRYL